jgi:hypothetical protein
MNTQSLVRPRWQKLAAAAVAFGALGVTATACGASPPSPPASVRSGSGAVSGGGTQAAVPGATPDASPSAAQSAPAQSAPAGKARAGCSIPALLAIAGESDSADTQRMDGWTTLQANDWTVDVPSSDWHLSASTAGGADIFSPDGSSSANLGDKEAQTPWTLASLGQTALASVSDLNVICQSQVERSSALTTQATEFTGVYQGAQIHGVVVLSLLAPTTSDFYAGEVRSIYTPAAQWSTAAEQTLWLIVKHAVFVPPQS